jgi:tetratricopeptide (TPR) repeat protein
MTANGTGDQHSPSVRIEATRDAYVAQVMHVHLPPPAPPPTPRELPPDVPDFTGRDAQMQMLDSQYASADQSSAVVISAVSGTAGVGKTALAIHWGHLRRDAFNDGLLYIDLRGYDPDQPIAPDEALAALLRSLGLEDPDIPSDLAERARKYRTILDGKRMLVLLDNAHEVEQVRWLLPGSSSCFVLVTSRDALTALVARHGARRLHLDLMSPDDAMALLRKLMPHRVNDEPEAAGVLAELCVRLPLALRIAAELAASRPAVPLADLATELADERRRLKLLDAGGDPRTAMRAVLSWSYGHLQPAAATTFRLLSLNPGRDIDLYGAAAITAAEPDTAEHDIGILTRAHLAHEVAPGRFGMHDLLNFYGRDIAAQTDDPTELRRALNRILDYYLYTAATAMDLLYPQEVHRRPRLSTSRPPSPVTDPTTARSWLDAERHNLVAICAYAARHDWWEHLNALGGTLYRYLDTGGHYFDALSIYQSVSDVAVQDQPCRANGRMHSGLGFFYWRLGRYRDATQQYNQALTLLRQENDRLGEAMTLSQLANLETQEGKRDQAITHNEQAIEIYRELGDELGEANTLANLGLVYQWWGRYSEALTAYETALDRHRKLGNHVSEAVTLGNIGTLHDAHDNHEAAMAYLNESLEKSRELGDRAGQSRGLANLGVVYRRTGQPEKSLEHFTESLLINQDLGNRTGEAISLGGIGLAHLALGRNDQAIDYLERALNIHREVGNRPEIAETLNELGQAFFGAHRLTEAIEAHRASYALADELETPDQQAKALDGIALALAERGKISEARRHWLDALNMYDDLGIPEGEAVRQRLASLDRADPESNA